MFELFISVVCPQILHYFDLIHAPKTKGKPIKKGI